MKRLNPLLDWFNDWFCSDAGTIQTLLVCLAVVVLEFSDPHLDPHAFLLMAVLTVYSAVTQPALARAGRVSSTQQEQMLDRLTLIEQHQSDLIEKYGALLDKLEQQLEPKDTL